MFFAYLARCSGFPHCSCGNPENFRDDLPVHIVSKKNKCCWFEDAAMYNYHVLTCDILCLFIQIHISLRFCHLLFFGVYLHACVRASTYATLGPRLCFEDSRVNTSSSLAELLKMTEQMEGLAARVNSLRIWQWSQHLDWGSSELRLHLAHLANKGQECRIVSLSNGLKWWFLAMLWWCIAFAWMCITAGQCLLHLTAVNGSVSQVVGFMPHYPSCNCKSLNSSVSECWLPAVVPGGSNTFEALWVLWEVIRQHILVAP